MNNYLITIIIPNHDVPAKTFQKCFDSIKNQTIGFENIELIIVVHNSPSYYPEIKEMTKDYENVKVLTLSDDCHSPSSPRNFALKHATGELITYVDADDWIPTTCLKPVIKHMQDKSIDIGITRRDYSLEDDTATPVANIVLWDQTQEEIIMTRDNIDNEKMFSGFWGTSTSKFYRREFLLKNNILFDETVHFSEDFLYNADAFNAAKKFCVMPQYITYHYFIRHGSLIQSRNQKPEMLIKYAEGFKKIFDHMINAGFWVDDTVCNMCYYFSLFMLGNESLTYEDRIKIKNILEPYLKMISPLKPSKLYTKKQVRDFYNFPNDVILNVEKWMKNDRDDNFSSISDTSKLMSVEQNVLNEIITNNMDTDVGKRFGFADMYSFSQYMSKVPLTNYDIYEPLIDLTTRVCESGIYSSDKSIDYLYSFGSFGVRKALPCTQAHINTYVDQVKKILDNKDTFYVYSNVYYFKKYNDENYLISIYGAMLMHYFTYLINNGIFKKIGILNLYNKFSEKYALDIQYIISVINISDTKITQIFAVNTFTLFMAFKDIKDNFMSICDDIENGTVRGKLDLSSDKRLITPNKKRADYLRNIYKSKNGNITLQDIWPKLKEIDACYSKAYQIYTDSLSKGLTNVVIKNSLLYTPEVMLGIDGDDEGNYKLNLKGAFYEFIDIDDKTNKTYRYKQLTPGKIYTVVVTNYAGLYRYVTKHKILVTRYDNDDLIFSLYTLDKNSLSIDNVLITDDLVYQSLRQALKQTNLEINDYCFYYENNSFNLYLDPIDDSLLNEIKCKETKELILNNLSKLIPNFEKINSIKEFNVIFLETNTILLSYEKRAIKGKTTINSLRVEHLINNISSLNYLDKFKKYKV